MDTNQEKPTHLLLNELLTTPVGNSKRTLVINEISIKEVKTRDQSVKQKLALKVTEPSTGKTFNVSDAYVPLNLAGSVNSGERWCIQGLWITMKADGAGNKVFNPNSALGKLLNYYNINSLQDLENLEVTAFPDRNNYLVLVACDLPNTDAEIFEKLT